MSVVVSGFPVLKSLIGDNSVDSITDTDALYVYQNNWAVVDTSKLSPEELALINRLVKDVGGGKFMAATA